MSFQATIVAKVTAAVERVAQSFGRKRTSPEQILGRLYLWQEISKHADSALKTAWAAAEIAGLIDNEETLRATLGERIAVESKHFRAIIKVAKSRLVFSRDKFIQAVASRFFLDPARLEEIAEEIMTESQPPLERKVMETPDE